MLVSTQPVSSSRETCVPVPAVSSSSFSLRSLPTAYRERLSGVVATQVYWQPCSRTGQHGPSAAAVRDGSQPAAGAGLSRGRVSTLPCTALCAAGGQALLTLSRQVVHRGCCSPVLLLPASSLKTTASRVCQWLSLGANVSPMLAVTSTRVPKACRATRASIRHPPRAPLALP